MKELSTLIKLSALLVIGGGTVGAAVGITEAQTAHEDIVENNEMVHAAESTEFDVDLDYRFDYSHIYIDISNVHNWVKGNNRVCLYFFENKENGKSEFTEQVKKYSDNIYVFDYPSYANYDNMIITSHYGSPASWKNSWAQTTNILDFKKSIGSAAKKNCFKVLDNGENDMSRGFESYLLTIENGMRPGQKVYFSAKPRVATFDWTEANAQFALRVKDAQGYETWSDFMKPAVGEYASFEKFYEVDLPAHDKNWTNFIIVRLNDTCISPDWSAKWADTNWVDISTTQDTCFYLTDDAGNSKYNNGSENIGIYNAGIEYAKTLSAITLDNCDPSGNTNDKIKSQWQRLENKFKSLPEQTQIALKNARISTSNNSIDKAISSYGYIVNKYVDNTQFNAFWLDRDAKQPALSNKLADVFNNPGTIVAVSILGASSLAMACFAFLNKKKRPLIK